jgi:hypothetical protein
MCMLQVSIFGGYGDKRLIFQHWLDCGASLLRGLGSNPNIAYLYLANLKKTIDIQLFLHESAEGSPLGINLPRIRSPIT